MEQDKIFRSRWFRWVVIGIAEFALMMLVFWAGMSVGLNKANFNYRWGEQYHMLFGGPRGGWFGGPGMMMGGRGPFSGRDNFVAPHGVVGTVLSADTSTIVIKDQRTNNEQSLVITPNTTIRKGDDTIKPTDLKASDRVVVIGAPSSSGQIEVQFMRVFDANN
jgi:hypothetical protein